FRGFEAERWISIVWIAFHRSTQNTKSINTSIRDSRIANDGRLCSPASERFSHTAAAANRSPTPARPIFFERT
ncbi:MAG TPA: hypothetical protein PLI34_16545, partial [Saprospiraceae bacterium]|nr:hypothetical protein [Saprospiraceae bacterium]